IARMASGDPSGFAGGLGRTRNGFEASSRFSCGRGAVKLTPRAALGERRPQPTRIVPTSVGAPDADSSGERRRARRGKPGSSRGAEPTVRPRRGGPSPWLDRGGPVLSDLQDVLLLGGDDVVDLLDPLGDDLLDLPERAVGVVAAHLAVLV